MKVKHLPAALILLLLAATSAQSKELDTVTRKDPGGWEFFRVVVIADQQPMIEGYYLKGKKEGVWNEYWPSRYPKSMTSYHNGKLHGMHMEINADGGLSLIEHYNDGELHGV